MGKGCAWIIGIVIVIMLFSEFPKFMFGLVGVGVVIFVGFCIADELKRKREAKAESEKRLKEAERRDEEAKKAADSALRQGYASEFKTKSYNTRWLCENNKNTGNKINLNPEYGAEILQGKIWDIIRNVSLNMQKLENTVEETNTKEDK